MDQFRFSAFSITQELRQESLRFIYQFEELEDPHKLREFTKTRELEIVYRCIPHSTNLNADADEFFNKLIVTGRTQSQSNGRSEFVPALIDLLDALALKHQNDVRVGGCPELKEKIRSELLQLNNQEQQEIVYERLAEASVSRDDPKGDNLAEQWINEAAASVDELALRVTLAVLSGATFEVIERAKNDLSKLLEPLMPQPKTEEPPPVIPYVPLMRRIQSAGARETAGEPPLWKRGVVLEPSKAEFAAEALRYVWQQYRETEWRRRLMQWLTDYSVGETAEVRTRVAVAVGVLAIQDYRYVTDNLLRGWIKKSAEVETDNRTAAQYRMAVGMALGVIAREKNWTSEVQSLVRKWSASTNPADRWTAIRAYIYVGTYCEPISDVIECWRRIAAAERIAIYIDVTDTIKLQVNNPMYMSLMDAMLRFFVGVAQLPEDASRDRLKGILEGLCRWIADKREDAGLGLFMFTTLGRLTVSPSGSQDVESPPLLVHLIENHSAQGDYRKQLAALFRVLMNDVETIIEARDLLCMWAHWINGLEDKSEPYEEHLQSLLKEINAEDRTGRMRGRLINSLRDCGRNSVLERAVANL